MLTTIILMTTISIPYQAYGQQFDFITTDKNFAAISGGIGSGKSMSGAMRAVMASCGQIGTQAIPTPNLGVVTAPTYPMLQDATLRTFRDIAGDLVIDYNKNEHRATLVNGSEILFRSADNPDRLRGPNVSWWWGDEAAYYSDKVMPVMLGRLRQHGRLGYAWVTTTPKGRNWVWKTFVRDATERHALFTLKTVENPFLDIAFYEALKAAYVGDWARQELEGVFVAFEGLIYLEFDRNLHTTTEIAVDLNDFKYVQAGVDWGFAHPGVIDVVGFDADGRAYHIHEEYTRHRSIDDWASVAAQLRDLYGVELFWCDPSEPDYIRKLQEAGCNALAADNAVDAGIQAVRARLVRRADDEPGYKAHTSCANTITEFEQYQWLEHRDGFKDVPTKANDHSMDALRYLFFNHDERVLPTIEVRTKKHA